jgi:hypothetical protein
MITTESEFAIMAIVIVAIGLYYMITNGRGVKP